jgi:hypothetical protein
LQEEEKELLDGEKEIEEKEWMRTRWWVVIFLSVGWKS